MMVGRYVYRYIEEQICRNNTSTLQEAAQLHDSFMSMLNKRIRDTI